MDQQTRSWTEARVIAADLARRFEGLRLKPYLCPAGIPTVGYGHTGPEVTLQSPAISIAIAEAFLRADVDIALSAAARYSANIVYERPPRFAAIGDFILNLGKIRYEASTLRRKIRDGEWHDAAEELGKWVWGGGRKLPGLVVRRAAEAALL